MKKVGLIGGGRMGEALVRGLIFSKFLPSDAVGVCDVDLRRLDHLHQEFGVATFKSNALLTQWADVIVLAVKPQIVTGVLRELAGGKLDGKLIVSIVAGLPLETIKAGLSPAVRVVRVMPNTPAQVLEGMSVLCFDAGLGEAEHVFVKQMFESVGQVVVTEDEKIMNVATALVGSGPAFVFLFIEAVADGAVRMGLPRDKAYAAAAQMVLGAAKLVLETGQHPGQLKDQVASPGGTTIEGLSALEKGGFRGLLIDAIEAATKRSEQLSPTAKK
ncbi:MAG: pyrroline-5-carboxylate reductase [Nitrospirae bacterium]|nr:pyrroline-5-carboxylate reductase [Nitrospirota bacterium]